MATLEAVLVQALELDTLDKVRLIERVTPKIGEEIKAAQGQPTQGYPSLWGACRELQPIPTAEDFAQARQEMWSGFPRKDIG